MRLYHFPMSSNARRAVMTALHLGTPDVELVVVDLGKGAHRQPEFLKLNPGHRVPVLVDGDFVLTESHAIMQYLAEKTPGQTLYPTELRARADVNRWLFWNAAHFQPAVAVLNWEYAVKKFLGIGDPDPNEVKRGEALVSEAGALLDAHLADRTWISGEGLTLADFAIASPLMSMAHARMPLGSFKHIAGWFERVQALPAWQKTAIKPPTA